MAFKWLGSMSGKNDPLIMKLPVYNLAVRKGALVSYAPGAASVAILASDAGTTVIAGIAQETTTTASTATATFMEVLILNAGDMVEADIYEIKNVSTVTATSGSTTTFVSTALKSGVDSFFKGAIIKVVSQAAGLAAGTLITVTASTNSSGALTFATQATAFATGDTIKIVSLGKTNIVGCKTLAVEETYGDTLNLAQTGAGAGSVMRVYDINDELTKVRCVISNGMNAQTTLVTS